MGLLGLGIIAEGIVEINKTSKFATEQFIYNIYIPLEYLCYALFFYTINTHTKIKRCILLSIVLFISIVFFTVDYKNIYTNNLFSLIYNISGVLTVIWSLWTLFILEPIHKVKFVYHPLFWICVGLIVFHAGSFPFNFLYNDLNQAYPTIFGPISNFIQKGLNIWLFLSFTTAFVCSHRLRK